MIPKLTGKFTKKDLIAIVNECVDYLNIFDHSVDNDPRMVGIFDDIPSTIESYSTVVETVAEMKPIRIRPGFELITQDVMEIQRLRKQKKRFLRKV